MRFLVSPEFTQKMASIDENGISAISKIINYIKENEKAVLITDNKHFQPRPLSNDIFLFDAGDHKIYVSFGQDPEGDYVILLDLAAESNKPIQNKDFFTTKNPKTNSSINPLKNSAIDPRRNMMIDPRRNMMVDPRRNMMIDPRRNMMIDPRRNMMIDPRRNMMIDPRRNMMIDPRRNMMIDPRRNSSYGGPFLYDTNLNQVGFIVRADDKVHLIFNKDSTFEGIAVSTDQGNKNIFNKNNEYIGFWVPANKDIYNRFDLNGSWLGIAI